MEQLFSYGTLQLDAVQIAQFGRRLAGTADALVGWRRDLVEITDPAVVALSGERLHPIVRETGDRADMVPGMVFPVSAADLDRADDYEVGDYVRVRTTLRSGLDAWVYVAASSVGGA